MSRWIGRLAWALVFGLLGGLLFQWLHLPLPWMLGPLMANLLASLLDVPVGVPNQLRSLFLGGLGLMLGGQASYDTLQQASAWPLSLLLLSLCVVVIVLCVAWYFQRIAGFDRASAWFSAVPGAMSAMILLGGQAGGDERHVALAHALRLTFVVMLIPPLFWLFYIPPAGAGAVQPAMNVWLLLGVAPAWWLAARLHLPSPEFVGPLTLGVVTALAGYPFVGDPVSLAVIFLVLGASIGARFYATPTPLLLRLSIHALVATLLALVVAAAFAALLHWLMDLPWATALLIMTPGGIGEMSMIALALGIDPVMVAAHHLFRILALVLLTPLMLALWRN